MEKIKPEDILNCSECFNAVNECETYHKSYYHFIRYFADKDEIQLEDLVIGANFVYGWMPTILNFKSDGFELAVEILNKAKRGEYISQDEFGILKRLINNSLVGVSKLLHFVNPDVYAIWDSRVCNFLTGCSYSYKVENIELYLKYLELCERITKDKTFDSIHRDYINKIGYEVSALRVVEQIMFINSSQPLHKKRDYK